VGYHGFFGVGVVWLGFWGGNGMLMFLMLVMGQSPSFMAELISSPIESTDQMVSHQNRRFNKKNIC
jgi:hypothetical protein